MNEYYKGLKITNSLDTRHLIFNAKSKICRPKVGNFIDNLKKEENKTKIMLKI